jgi:hypothetical protein
MDSHFRRKNNNFFRTIFLSETFWSKFIHVKQQIPFHQTVMYVQTWIRRSFKAIKPYFKG